MKLAPKILSLPIIVSLFLVALSAVVVFSLDKIAVNVKTVTRTLAPQANQATALLQNILDRQSMVQEYLRTGDDSLIAKFQELQTANAAMVQQFDSLVEDQSTSVFLQKIRSGDASYSSTYLQDVVTQAQLIDSVSKQMSHQIGPEVVQSLTDIIASISVNGLESVGSSATEAIKAFQGAQLFVSQYVLHNDDTDKSRVEMELLATGNALYDLEQRVLEPRRIALANNAINIFEDFSSGFLTIVKAVEARNQAVSGSMATQRQEIVDAAMGLQNAAWSNLDASGNTVEQTIEQTLKTVGITTVLALILGLVPAIFITHSIKRAIQQTVTVAERIAHGELVNDITIRSKDETGQLLGSLSRMIENLTNVVNKIQGAAGTVKSGVSDISTANSNLNSRTTSQSDSLKNTATSIESMTQAVKENAENAVQASELAKDARIRAEKSSEVFTSAVAAMDEISQSSQKITQIISVIDEIAFQTNLLALNASVEAARAGESGRGFAVVASEVRNLAGRSATAANEIKSLIVDSKEKVEDGTALVDSSRESLKEIVDDVKQVSDVVSNIAAANQQQSSEIEAVNRAIESMDELTRQNKALVEGAARASQDLGNQANELDELTTFFKSA